MKLKTLMTISLLLGYIHQNCIARGREICIMNKRTIYRRLKEQYGINKRTWIYALTFLYEHYRGVENQGRKLIVYPLLFGKKEDRFFSFFSRLKQTLPRAPYWRKEMRQYRIGRSARA